MLSRTVAGIAAIAATVAGSVTLLAGPAAAGHNAHEVVRGTTGELQGVALATYTWTHADDTFKVCDVREDGLRGIGRVWSIDRETGNRTLEILVDDLADGACVTVSKDLVENTALVMGVLVVRGDGSTVTSSGAWATA